MEGSNPILIERLEEIDRQLQAFDAVLELAVNGADGYGNGDMIKSLATHVRSVLTDMRAELDEVTGALLVDKPLRALI